MFDSFFIAGFECASQISYNRERLDLTRQTLHDKYINNDYNLLKSIGIRTARDGIRWYLIERKPGKYDFSSVLPMIKAASKANVQVIWDLCHYGWPDHIDIFKKDFIDKFVNFSVEFINFLKNESDRQIYVCPINEISYLSWASGESGYMYPFGMGRGDELKIQLSKAYIECSKAILNIDSKVRLVNVDPLINVLQYDGISNYSKNGYNESQYTSRNIIVGKELPNLGGSEKYLDIIGVNYYPFNQWIKTGTDLFSDVLIDYKNPLYKPLNILLKELHEKYNCPLFISETGAEGIERVEWIEYIFKEVKEALNNKVPIHGLCWYPILDNQGWDDGRHCSNGLWSYANEEGKRSAYIPLLDKIREYM